MIAALYVMKNGPYYGLPHVDPWDLERDAKLYAGPWPVVAHPPCERWGRYWSGGPSSKIRKIKGADQGCFAAALASVRRWGGILEHPAHSAAWGAFNLNRPFHFGGWIAADFEGGWTCYVEQGHYGHPSRKATWLYAKGIELPKLKWGYSGQRLPAFGASYEKSRRRGIIAMMPKKDRAKTPIEFRDLLIAMAESANGVK